MDAEMIEYFKQLMPEATAICAGCDCEFPLRAAAMRGDKPYHSADCADRSTAVLVKPTLRKKLIDGWDV